MTDKTHQLIGLTAASASVLLLHPDSIITWPLVIGVVTGSILGSVAPDIDQPTAHIWAEIPLFGRLFGKVASLALGGHRNLSHSLLGVVLFSGLAWWLTRPIPVGAWIDAPIALQSFVIGFTAHLVADAVTVMGVPLLWPYGGCMGFPPRPFQGIRIVTGKWFENLVIFPGVTVLLITLLWSHIHQFCTIIPSFCR